jgi:Uma2 family endonuclease
MTEHTFNTEKQENTVAEPSVAYQSRRYTYADYLTWNDDIRCELIDGSVYALSAPQLKHAEITGNLFSSVKWFIRRRKGKCKIFHAPFDVRLSLTGETDDDKIETVVQPDICVICDLSKTDERGCLGAPDLIVEVLSPSTCKRDLNENFVSTKRREYANTGSCILTRRC